MLSEKSRGEQLRERIRQDKTRWPEFTGIHPLNNEAQARGILIHVTRHVSQLSHVYTFSRTPVSWQTRGPR